MADNDALLTNQMPHSPQAEQAVLGSMLIDADCVKDVMDQLQTQDFYLRTNRDIFETIYQMFVYSKPIDGVTVAGEMEKNGKSNEQTRSYLVQLMEVTPTSANVMEYVRIVQEKSLMRQVAFAAGRITAMVQQGTGSAGDMLEAAEQRIYAIRRGRSAQGMVPVSMVLGDVMSQLAELSARGGKSVPGLSTGLSAVDAKINGMNKSDLLLLAARPGMGKTSMALNVALSAARESGKTVAIFSLEMSKEQLVTRLIASEGLVENQRLITGNLRESDWQRIAEAASALSCMDIRIDDNPSLSVADMNAQCRRQMAARRKAAGQRRHICKTLTQYVHRLACLFQRKFAQRFSLIAGILQHSCRPTACVECTGNRFALTRRNPLVATARTNEHHAPNRFRRDIQRQNAARFKPQNLIGLHVLRPVSQSPK